MHAEVGLLVACQPQRADSDRARASALADGRGQGLAVGRNEMFDAGGVDAEELHAGIVQQGFFGVLTYKVGPGGPLGFAGKSQKGRHERTRHRCPGLGRLGRPAVQRADVRRRHPAGRCLGRRIHCGDDAAAARGRLHASGLRRCGLWPWRRPAAGRRRADRHRSCSGPAAVRDRQPRAPALAGPQPGPGPDQPGRSPAQCRRRGLGAAPVRAGLANGHRLRHPGHAGTCRRVGARRDGVGRRGSSHSARLAADSLEHALCRRCADPDAYLVGGRRRRQFVGGLGRPGDLDADDAGPGRAAGGGRLSCRRGG